MYSDAEDRPSIWANFKPSYLCNRFYDAFHICFYLESFVLAVSVAQIKDLQQQEAANNYTVNSSSQRLIKLQLESLELRRLRLDLIFAYKVVFGLTDLNLSEFLKLRTD